VSSRFRRSIHIAPGIRLNLGRRGPFRFRHSIRLAPGIRLNIGRRGLPTPLGGRVAHVTVGRNAPRATASEPGTGFSYAVISAARLLGAAVMMALLFLWTAGWL
jgi:hypothetical protein